MQPYIRGGVLENFAATVEMLGGDTERLLREADVAPEVLTVPGIFMPYASYMRLLDAAARSTGTPHFGLIMARSGNAETLGTIGIIMTQAESVGAAWETLIHFYRIHDTYGRVRLYRYPETVMISYALPRNDEPGSRQVYDVAAEITCNIMRRFCGAGFHCTEINFPYAEPPDTRPYAELPTDRVSFGASAVEMHVPAALMRQPLERGGDGSRSAAGDYFAANAGQDVLAARVVEERIRSLLPVGECSLPRIASTLATTPRTLQARLESEHTTFREILENVRKEIATYHLRRGDMQLTQLAMLLGYSELSAFSRSFRAWYGVSPRRWVEQGDWRA